MDGAIQNIRCIFLTAVFQELVFFAAVVYQTKRDGIAGCSYHLFSKFSYGRHEKLIGNFYQNRVSY